MKTESESVLQGYTVKRKRLGDDVLWEWAKDPEKIITEYYNLMRTNKNLADFVGKYEASEVRLAAMEQGVKELEEQYRFLKAANNALELEKEESSSDMWEDE